MNLFFHQAALGDFVLTFPILHGLCAQKDRTIAISDWCLAQLAVVVIKGAVPMNIERREFTQLHVEGEADPANPDVGELFERATRIVSFVSNGTDTWARNVTRMAPGAELLFVESRPPDDWPGHVSEWHRAQLQRQGLEMTTKIPALSVSPDGPIVVHPGSGGSEKCWPVERFERLVDDLRAAGQTIQPVLGEVELATWLPQDIIRWRSDLEARVIGTPVELFELLSTASAYVGNDSGPTHLAGQLGILTFALFGPTDPLRWAPLGPRVKVIAPDRPSLMDWLSVETVLTQVTTVSQWHK